MKNKKMLKLLAGLLSAALLSGCGTSVPGETTATTQPTQTAVSTSAMAIADEEEHITSKEPSPITVGLKDANYLYTPFSTEGDYDRLMNKLTGTALLSKDRNGKPVLRGKSGQFIMYGEKSYIYKGAADISGLYNEETDITSYTVNLRDNITFGDGEKLNADDLIFTLYVLLDPDYSGSIPLKDANIVGALNYRMNSDMAEEITEEEIKALMESDKLNDLIRTEIIVPEIEKEFETVKTLYGDSSYAVYTEAYEEPKDLMAHFYAIDSEYDSSDKDEKTVLSDIAGMYGSNYRLLASMVSGNEDYYDNELRSCAVRYITEEKGGSSSVPLISGITKTGNFSVTIDVKGKGKGFYDILSEITIAPLHYYGNEEEYNYINGNFGFRKGTASEVIANKAGSPLGAGAYTFEKAEGGIVYLKAYEGYYKGAPKTDEIHIVSVASGKETASVIEGTADIVYPESSAVTSEEILAANKSLEKLNAFFSEEEGYGYIGINAKTVNIGGEAVSEESIYLRKALASVIAYYKDGSVNEYFGRDALTTDYPVAEGIRIPEVSEITAEGEEIPYIKPYSLNAEGESFIGEAAFESEQLTDLKAACADYLGKAGYTIENGRVTTAPEGGKKSFSLYILGNGEGNHPLYTAVKKASDLLSEIGITLEIKDTADPSVIWDEISKGTQELWAGSWSEGLDVIYAEKNYYGTDTEKISEKLINAREITENEEKIKAYKEIYDEIMALGVEIPCYRREGCTVFSSLRIDTASLPEAMTEYYRWEDEAENIVTK